MRLREQSWTMDSKDLNNRIDQLEELLQSLSSGRPDWKTVWSQIKEINGGFKGTRFPTRDERESAWVRFQSIVERVKSAQSQYHEERKARTERSADHLAQIKSLVSLAQADSGLGDLALFMATGGLSLVTKVALDAVLGKSDDEHQGLRGRSDAMKSAWAYLSEHKSEMNGRDKATAYSLLKETKDRLDSDWQRWKDHRQEIVETRQRERQARHDEWKAKQEAWRGRQLQFISRLEGAEEKLEAALYRRQEHLEKLMDQYESAWSDDFRSRVEEWIDEERGRISDIETKLEDVRYKLSDARLRLDS